MNPEELRKFCLSFPHATEDVKWGNDLCFCVGEKMFCVTGLEAGSHLSFKTTPENFAELIELDGIVPAPYVARYHWVALERFDALPEKILRDLIGLAYQLVFEKLPKSKRTALEKSSR